jgi:phosphate:Na+ symporter
MAAIAALTTAAGRRADVGRTFELLAEAYEGAGQPQQAINAWQQAVTVSPGNAAYYTRLGDALDALQAEIGRLRALSVRALRRALGAAVPPAGAAPVPSLEDAQAQAAREHTVAHALQRAVADFVVRLQRAEMSADSAARLPVLLRVARYAEVATAQAEESVAASLRADAALATTVALTPLEQAFAGAVQELLSALDALGAAAAPDDGPGGGPAGGPVEPRLRRVADALAGAERRYAQLKAALLRRGAEGQLAIEAMQERLDALSALRRGLQQAVKAVQWAHGGAAPAAAAAAG